MTEKEAETLYRAWKEAYRLYLLADHQGDWDHIDEVREAEQVATDAVVDFVEANDLNGSRWDPRNVEGRA